MICFDDHFFTMALPDAQFVQGSIPEHCFFSVDSRTISQGDIFVALHGENVDGHAFIGQAFDNGAAGIMIDAEKKGMLASLNAEQLKNKLIIACSSAHQALIRLAYVWRAQFDIPVVGITGSVGKTSTKEMLAHIVHEHGQSALISQGNQNTLIGISLNLLRMRPGHKVAIFELGISKRSEMAELVNLVRPTYALITTVGHSHMEGLGSLHDIAVEKRDIFKLFDEKSIGIINGDIPLLSKVSYVHPVIRFGCKTSNQIQARKIRIEGNKTQFLMKLYKQKYEITIPYGHLGFVYNALAATSLAYMLNIPDNVIVRALQQPLSIKGRFNVIPARSGGSMIIDDCYNANPESMKASLVAFEHYETSLNKIAVIGDMLELGTDSLFWHRQIGRFLRKVPSLKRLILVGDLVQSTKKTVPMGLPVEAVATWQDALELLRKDEALNKSLILVKASHGMALTKLVDHLTETTI